MEDRVKLIRVVVNPSDDSRISQTFEAQEGIRLSCWWPEESGNSRLLVRELNEETGAFIMHEWPAHAVGRVVRTHA